MIIAVLRFLKRYGFAIIAISILGSGVAFVAIKVRAMNEHNRVVKTLDLAILRLAEYPPPELTDDQWAYCVLWTWNLHSNYSWGFSTTERLEQLEREINQRINQGVDLKTIDWLWDRYMELIPRAKNFDHFRPTAESNREGFERGDHGGNPLPEWHQRYLDKLAEIKSVE